MSNVSPVPGQAVITAATVGYAYLAVSLASLLILIVWAGAAWWRGRQHDVGPDALRLQQDLDRYMDRLARRDPEVKAGLARLDAAVRGKQRPGEGS